MAKKNGNKKSRFNLYNLFAGDGSGRGVAKTDDNGKRDAITFFKFYGRNFYRLLIVNLLMVFGNFPLIFGLFAMSGYLNGTNSTPASQLFAPLHGVMLHTGSNPINLALYGVHGTQSEISVNTPATLILFALTALVIFTWGYVNVGTTYILRNMVKGEPIFLWQDFWYAIKRNLKGGMLMGIIDAVCIGLLAYDVVFFYFNIGSFMNNVLFYLSLLLALIYIIMRFYIYNLLITFDLSFFKIFKNALIFTVLGIGRNLGALVAIVIAGFVNYSLLLMFIPLGLLLPFVITFSTGAFAASWAAFPKIKEIMIDPYAEEEIKPAEEPIFHDMG
ncbi:MAG: YesL family protein [Eubacteriales bacterium]